MYLKLCILGKRASTLPMAISTFVRNELMKFFCYFLPFCFLFYVLFFIAQKWGGGGGGAAPIPEQIPRSPGLFTRQKKLARYIESLVAKPLQ